MTFNLKQVILYMQEGSAQIEKEDRKMGIVIAIIVIFVLVSVFKAWLSVKNEPDMDDAGNMRCKGCGGSNFKYWTNKDGSTTYECHRCGKRWTRY